MVSKTVTKNLSGFTLLELSIVLVIMSLMLGGILAALAQQSRIAKNAELEMKMDAIEQALVAYASDLTNLALPYPANHSIAYSNNCFGRMWENGACSDLPKNGSSNVSSGTVPVRSLGLPDEYAFDPWGNRFTYKVSDVVANYPGKVAILPFSVNGISASLMFPGHITVRDPTGVSTIATAVVAAIISHGPNGFGAFSVDGIIKTGYSTSTGELNNCNCTTAAAIDVGVLNAPFVGVGTNRVTSSDAADNFDDTVRYYNRAFFVSKQNLKTE